MTKPRKRWIVSRAALAMAVTMMLLGWYVGAWLAFTRWAASGGTIPHGPYREIRPVVGGIIVKHVAFGPIHDYIGAGHPGAELLSALWSQAAGIRSAIPARAMDDPDAELNQEIDQLLSDVPH